MCIIKIILLESEVTAVAPKVNQLKFGAVLSYASLAIGVVVSLVYTPIMLQRLGTQEFGVYNLVLPIVSYLNLLSFGLGSTYTRYYSRYRVADDQEGLARLNGMFLTIYSILGTLVLILGLILAAGMHILLAESELTAGEIELARTLMYILSVNAAVSFPIIVFESNVMVNEQYLFQKLVAIGKTVFNPLVMIPLLLMGCNSVVMVVVTLIFTVLSGVVNIAYCLKKLNMKFKFGKLDAVPLKEMLSYTFYIFIGILVDQINWSMDRIILGFQVGSTAISVYTIGSQLHQYFLTMSNSFSGLLTPRVHRLVASGSSDKELTALFTRIGRLQFLLLSMILLGFIAVGRAFCVCWGGGEPFEISYYIAIALFIPTVVQAIQSLGIEIQRAKNMHRFRSLVYLGVSLANVAVSIPLGRLFAGLGQEFTAAYGAEFSGAFAGFGCALGTASAILLGNIPLMNWYYRKHIGLGIGSFWKSILSMVPGMLIPTAAALAIAIWAPVRHSYLDVVLWGIVFVIVYAASVWLFSMNDSEKDIIRVPLKRLLKR